MNQRQKKWTALFLSALAAGMMSLPVSAGWQKNGSSYSYTDANGNAPNGFYQVDGQWYYFAQGRMLTGWQEYDYNWYYMNTSGVMQTGWQKIGGAWYYFYSSGRMAKGWGEIGGEWYYFNAGGAMKTGWVQSGGNWYFFNGGGAMKTGWVQTGGKWYYFNDSGVMQTRWVQTSGKWYYFDGNGVMQTGTLNLNGVSYTFGSSGALTSGNPPASVSSFDPETVRSTLNGVSLSAKTTVDSALNTLVSKWISSNIKSSMDSYTKVKTAYDYLLTMSVGEADTSVVNTTGMTMDQLMDLYFSGPEYNAQLMLAGKKGTEEHFAAGLAALLRGMGFDAEVAEGIVYQDGSFSSAVSSSWVVVTIGREEYIFDAASDAKAGGGYAHFCRTSDELDSRYQQSDVFSFR